MALQPPFGTMLRMVNLHGENAWIQELIRVFGLVSGPLNGSSVVKVEV